jgi:hypothetical protein
MLFTDQRKVLIFYYPDVFIIWSSPDADIPEIAKRFINIPQSHAYNLLDYKEGSPYWLLSDRDTFNKSILLIIFWFKRKPVWDLYNDKSKKIIFHMNNLLAYKSKAFIHKKLSMSICFGPRLAYSTDLISSNLFEIDFIQRFIFEKVFDGRLIQFQICINYQDFYF